MSDISIPGVNSKYESLVEALMKKERIPRDREAESLEKLKLQDKSWKQLNKLSVEVKDIAKNLYSYSNPFAEKLVESTNERSLTATADRSVKDQTIKLNVIQVAEADKFISSEIDDELKIPKGKYSFRVGEKAFSLNWRGGKYKSFINSINKRGKKILNIKEIKITPESKSLLFSSEITGEKNKLVFEDDALTLALKLGLIKKNDTSAIKVSKTSLNAKPESNQKITFSETVRAKDQYTMELKISVRELSDEEKAKLGNNNNDDKKIYEKIGSISYKGVFLQNERSKDGIVENNQSESSSEKTEINDMNVLALESTRGVMIPLPPLADTEDVQSIRVPMADYGNVKALAVNNNNSKKYVLIESVKIYDPKATGEYVPVKPVSTAQDSIVNFEGIQIKRDTNKVDDLVPGITLNLYEPSDKQEKITVKPDVELVKNSLIEFVAKYNRLLAEVNIVTKNQPEVIDELGYLSEEESKSAEEKLGIAYGDSTLRSYKSKLQSIVSMPYKSSDDTNIFMLSQLGISTKSDKSSGVDMSRLRGYLEIDEKKLDEALQNNMEDVKLFFGFDSDGDILIDSGLAHALYEQINPYTQRGGIFSIKTNSLKTRMVASEKKLENYDKKLEQKEVQLRRKYGAMEGAVKNLEKQSDAIKNFSKQNQGGN